MSLGRFGFTPVLGIDQHGPVCYLLEVDDIKILLDCGWDHNWNPEDIQALTRMDLSDVNAVLISHPDLLHLGALPHAFNELNLDCPVYCTTPVWKLGHLALYDAYQALCDSRGKDDPAAKLIHPDKIDDVFYNRFTQVKPLQEFDLTAGENSVVLTPYAAGHMLGGCFWRITKDTEQIVYAIDYNHKKDRHLPVFRVDNISRPSLLITDAYNMGYTFEKKGVRDHKLITTALKTLRQGGNVLIPSDSGGRSLELLMILHHYWRKQEYYKIYSLVFLSYTAGHVQESIKTFLEWTNDDCRGEFDQKRKNPFTMQGLIIARTLKELREKAKQPMVVVASNEYMEAGFSQRIFMEWCVDPNNAIILTSRQPKASVAGKLLNLTRENRRLKFTFRWKVKLTGVELERALAKRKADEKAQQTLMEEDDEEESEDDQPMEVDNLMGPVQKKRIMMVPDFPMFPFEERRAILAPYGEHVDLSKIRESKQDRAEKDSKTIQFINARTGNLDAKAAASKAAAERRRAKRRAAEMRETPEKCMSMEKELEVRCAVCFIDHEGRSDGKSVQELIKQIHPRKMILVHADLKQKEDLSQICSEGKFCNQIIVPKASKQTINLQSDTNIWKFVLSPALDSSLQFSKIMDYEVAYVDGSVQTPKVEAGKENAEPFLIPAAAGGAAEARSGMHAKRKALYLGDLKLLEVKRALEKRNVPAMLGDGQLVAGKSHCAKIERRGGDKLSIRGSLCEEYFQVRKILTDLYTLL